MENHETEKTNDTCIDAIAVSFQIVGPENKVWQAERMYSYDM